MAEDARRPGPADLVEALEKLRAILSAAQGQVTIALDEAARLPSPPRAGRAPCPLCGISRPQAELDDHLVNVHGLDAPSCLVTEGSVAGVNGLTTLGQEDL